MDIKARNILYVRMNAAGELWIQDEAEGGGTVDISALKTKVLRNRVKAFVKNEQNSSKLPEKHVKNIDNIISAKEKEILTV